jgi:hypothetical protein
MKFLAEPSLVVKLHKPVGLFKYVIFDENGEYETNNKKLQRKLMLHFPSKTYECKFCQEKYLKKGDLLSHYRLQHKGVDK